MESHVGSTRQPPDFLILLLEGVRAFYSHTCVDISCIYLSFFLFSRILLVIFLAFVHSALICYSSSLHRSVHCYKGGGGRDSLAHSYSALSGKASTLHSVILWGIGISHTYPLFLLSLCKFAVYTDWWSLAIWSHVINVFSALLFICIHGSISLYI